jgi:O-antigen/teichoic acid export membrane protein
MNTLKRSSINMFSSALGYIVPMLINLITTPLLLKGLGETAYGLQSLVAVIIGYLAFMDMGLDLPITKFLAEDRARNDKLSENHLLSTTLQLYLYIGLGGMIIIILLSDWLAKSVFSIPYDLIPQAILVFKISAVGFLGSVGMSWGRALAMGIQRFDITYSVSIVINTAGTLLGLGVVYVGYGVVGYVLTRMIITMLAGPTYFILTRRLIPEFHFIKGLNNSTLKRVSSYLGYGTFNRITSSLVSRLDQTLIGVWVGVAAAGIYSVPFLVISSFGYMLAYMLGFIFPMASELQSLNQMDRLREIFIRSSQFIAALAGVIFIPLFILGDNFFKLWTPSIASQVGGVFRLLCVAGYIGTLSATLSNSIMIGIGKIRQFTVYMTIRSIVLAILCLIFIHNLGLIGAGWALLFTSIIDITWFLLVLVRFLKITSMNYILRNAYLKPLVLTVGIAIVTLLLRPVAVNWVGLISVGIIIGLIFIFLGFLLGVFGETEKRAIREMILIFKK